MAVKVIMAYLSKAQFRNGIKQIICQVHADGQRRFLAGCPFAEAQTFLAQITQLEFFHVRTGTDADLQLAAVLSIDGNRVIDQEDPADLASGNGAGWNLLARHLLQALQISCLRRQAENTGGCVVGNKARQFGAVNMQQQGNNRQYSPGLRWQLADNGLKPLALQVEVVAAPQVGLTGVGSEFCQAH